MGFNGALGPIRVIIPLPAMSVLDFSAFVCLFVRAMYSDNKGLLLALH